MKAPREKSVAYVKGTVRRRTCGAMQVHHRLLEQFPEFRFRQADLEQATRLRLASGKALRTGLITIPTVVHIVYNTGSENISDDQVKSQINGLNRNFPRRQPRSHQDTCGMEGVVRGCPGSLRVGEAQFEW